MVSSEGGESSGWFGVSQGGCARWKLRWVASAAPC
jgi:hypothetical protein